MLRLLLLAALLAPTTACRDAAAGGGGARRQVRVVGSSTVFPFTAAVAERFVAADPRARAPVIESTGTGAGIRLFCAGIGAAHPDIAAASRRLRAGEYAECARNGVRDVIEVPIGIDGLAFAESPAGPALRLAPADLYLALAAAPRGVPNTARTWRDVSPGLPPSPIRVYGPPATSGTRDALAELVLARGCAAVHPHADALARSDPAAHRRLCTRVRTDGAFVDAGENDNLIVQKLQADPAAIGVLGYAYLEENAGALRGLPLAGVAPTYRTIADGSYPGARPLFLYVKRAHLAAVPGLRGFLHTYVAAWGPAGPLVRRGLIASPARVRAAAAQTVTREKPLDPRVLG